MKKGILIDRDGDASTVLVTDTTQIGDEGTYYLVDDSDVDYVAVSGKIVDIE
jgi:hypothetical protein